MEFSGRVYSRKIDYSKPHLNDNYETSVKEINYYLKFTFLNSLFLVALVAASAAAALLRSI